MDIQLNQLHDIAKKDLYDLEQACLEYCHSQYDNGKNEVMRQMLAYCLQYTNGDLRNMSIGALLHYLQTKRNSISLKEEPMIVENVNKRQLTHEHCERQYVQINYERLCEAYNQLC